jgi:hypothetical protein
MNPDMTKMQLVISTQKATKKLWTYMPFIPRIGEWFNVKDILRDEEIEDIKATSPSWKGIHGAIRHVEYRHDDNEYYVEVLILCE